MADNESTDRFIRTRDWARRLDLTIERVDAMIAAGELPEPTLAFEGSLRWTEEQYAEWSAANSSTQQPK